jgi:hypothetical protein
MFYATESSFYFSASTPASAIATATATAAGADARVQQSNIAGEPSACE